MLQYNPYTVSFSINPNSVSCIPHVLLLLTSLLLLNILPFPLFAVSVHVRPPPPSPLPLDLSRLINCADLQGTDGLCKGCNTKTRPTPSLHPYASPPPLISLSSSPAARPIPDSKPAPSTLFFLSRSFCNIEYSVQCSLFNACQFIHRNIATLT